MIREKPIATSNGVGVSIVMVIVLAALVWAISHVGGTYPRGAEKFFTIAAMVACILVDLLFSIGFFAVEPNTGVVITMFGSYRGTERRPGLHWINPFLYSRKAISLRARNFETAKLKVNDHDGNPIEIGTIVVWQVEDTAEASFEVDNYEHYVHVQSESALRNLATSYPYDAHVEGQMSLRGNTADVAAHLQREIEERLAKAGVKVLEARISHLAYAPEVAMAMLQRQQASAIVAARTKIVEGAVGMVELALDQLAQKQVVVLDDERKAAMVSNLLVVLCGDRSTQPVVNTGSLYT
ncbi:MAG: SPFH domain-containing protein [Acidobacteria bacterium]|nr:SPFH domain-containing protein [Acidobacteriota bacterium]